MPRLLLKIINYPQEIEVTEEELNLEGRETVIRECHMESDGRINNLKQYKDCGIKIIDER